MPYAMSVIISRAIPEIDGFKPSHRKLLYTMYKMGLINGSRIKSANVVGRTMQLNPHGDAAIYETMVRLTEGHQALLHPLVDSKGNIYLPQGYSSEDGSAAVEDNFGTDTKDLGGETYVVADATPYIENSKLLQEMIINGLLFVYNTLQHYSNQILILNVLLLFLFLLLFFFFLRI